jgi:lipoprotein-releasing system permease protein
MQKEGLKDYEKLIAPLLKYPQVESASPFILGKGLIATVNGTDGIMVRGIDPKLEARSPKWDEYVKAGELTPKGIMLGDELAKRLAVGIGDKVALYTGIGKQRTYTVTGLFQAGLYEYDAHIAFLSIAEAQSVYSIPNYVTGISVRLKNPFEAPQLAETFNTRFPVVAQSWTDTNHSLLGALQLEKRVIFLVVLFIIVVAMMGISNTLAMWALEMRREMSLLRAVGATSQGVGLLMVIEGMLVSFLGVLLGCLIGVGLSVALTIFPIGLPSDIYYIDKLPVEMRLADFLLVAVSAFAISLVACFLPMRKAVKLDPIEIIRQV